MSANSTNSTSGGNETVTLPPSLDLSPHLSAQKYFFVCTLTVAAWDVLVLTPRTWRLMKSRGWPLLKLIYYFLRLYVPIEFTIVGMSVGHFGRTSGLIFGFQVLRSSTPLFPWRWAYFFQSPLPRIMTSDPVAALLQVLLIRADLYRYPPGDHLLRPCLPYPCHIRQGSIHSLWDGQPFRSSGCSDGNLLRFLPRYAPLRCSGTIVLTLDYSDTTRRRPRLHC